MPTEEAATQPGPAASGPTGAAETTGRPCDHRCLRRRQCVHRKVEAKKAEAALRDQDPKGKGHAFDKSACEEQMEKETPDRWDRLYCHHRCPTKAICEARVAKESKLAESKLAQMGDALARGKAALARFGTARFHDVFTHSPKSKRARKEESPADETAGTMMESPADETAGTMMDEATLQLECLWAVAQQWPGQGIVPSTEPLLDVLRSRRKELWDRIIQALDLDFCVAVSSGAQPRPLPGSSPSHFDEEVMLLFQVIEEDQGVDPVIEAAAFASEAIVTGTMHLVMRWWEQKLGNHHTTWLFPARGAHVPVEEGSSAELGDPSPLQQQQQQQQLLERTDTEWRDTFEPSEQYEREVIVMNSNSEMLRTANERQLQAEQVSAPRPADANVTLQVLVGTSHKGRWQYQVNIIAMLMKMGARL